MDRQYHALPIRELGDGAGFRRPTQPRAARVTLESPALEVMTDLALTTPAIIRPQAPIEGATQVMMTRGVRLLMVVDYGEVVRGVITAVDIQGENALRVATERRIRRDELTVADVMTPADRVEVLALEEVAGARVGHVLETLRRLGRQHALVIDHDVLPAHGPLDKPVRRAMVRGLFSASQVARQLGVALESGGEVARTFSEIESALAR